MANRLAIFPPHVHPEGLFPRPLLLALSFLGFTHFSCVLLPASSFAMEAVGARRARSPTRVFFVPPSRHLLCSLCDDHFKEIVLPCGHTFCRACVVRWFERQRTCPE